MMTLYGADFDAQIVESNLHRIGNQIFKLLPMREEGQNWLKPLETLAIELAGMSNLFPDQKDMFTLSCKLEGLRVTHTDFPLYRRTIFECCSLIDKLKKQCQ